MTAAANTNVADDRLIMLPRVKEMTGLSKAMLYRLIRRGDFPRPFKPGGNASRWSEREVGAWVGERGAERDAA